MTRNSSRRRSRKFAFEQLESRNLLTTIVTNGIRVHYTDTTTQELGGGPISILVDMVGPPGGFPTPASNVTFSVSSSNPNEGTPDVTSITFTPQNWSLTQSIIVTGIDDPGLEPLNADDGHVNYAITFGLVDSNHVAYDGTAIPGVILTNLDNDIVGFNTVDPVPYDEDVFPNHVYPGAGIVDLAGPIFPSSWHVSQVVGPTVGLGDIEPPVFKSFTYTAPPDWYGDVEVDFWVTNNWGDVSGPHKHSFTVRNVPDLPVAVADGNAACEEDGFVDIPNVVANDTDVDNWPINLPLNTGLTIASVNATGGMAITINNGTGIKFTPSPNLNSVSDPNAFSVTYWVKDAEGNVSANSSTIPIFVAQKNDKPNANGAAGVGTLEHEEVSFSTMDDWGEGDEYVYQELAYTILTQPSQGGLSLMGQGGWTVYAAGDRPAERFHRRQLPIHRDRRRCGRALADDQRSGDRRRHRQFLQRYPGGHARLRLRRGGATAPSSQSLSFGMPAQ